MGIVLGKFLLRAGHDPARGIKDQAAAVLFKPLINTLRHVRRRGQAQLAAPPQYIAAGARPFMRDQIAQFGLGQPIAEILAQIRHGLRLTQNALDPRTIGMGHTLRLSGGKERPAAAHIGQKSGKTARQI
ncbi:hypothetical protein E4T56_gene9061, partial [Termitomyces sp. T112]